MNPASRIGWLFLMLLMGVSIACSDGTTLSSEKTEPKQEGSSFADGGETNGPEPQPEKGSELEKLPTEKLPTEKLPTPSQKVFGGKRPVTIKLPPKYDPSKPLPLVVILHGAGVSGDLQTAYFGFTLLQEEKKFLLLAPDGTISKSLGARIWNATDACCDADNSGVDDLGYIKGLVEEVKSVYKVDEKRIFLVGHSNGGFMSYRMACDASDSITSIAILAGASFHDKSRCKPSRKVNILHIHGTKDTTIRYGGGVVPVIKKMQPGAERSVDMWGSYNGCTGARKVTGMKLDLISDLTGDETIVQMVEGCPQGGKVELWAIQNGAHIPTVSPNFAKEVWKWLLKQTEE